MASINLEGVSKTYTGGIQALREVTLALGEGEFVAVVGLSGAGKSTLLRCINRLVEPTAGRVRLDGRDVTAASGRELRRLRSEIGMIFQTFNLVRRSTVLRNVLQGRLAHVPLWRGLLGLFPAGDVAWAVECLDRVGIVDKTWSRADQLSGGQQQRVGIARALCQRPRVILADEPVASLDPPNAHAVLRDLKRICREDGITTLINLHAVELARQYADRVIGLREGRMVFDGPVSEADEPVFERIYGRRVDEHDTPGAPDQQAAAGGARA